MATKTITITTDAYEKLVVFKEPRESFSEVINRIVQKHSLRDLVGMLNEKEAKEIEAHIKKSNERMRAQIEKNSLQLK